jgi:hypothetical protein
LDKLASQSIEIGRSDVRIGTDALIGHGSEGDLKR